MQTAQKGEDRWISLDVCPRGETRDNRPLWRGLKFVKLDRLAFLDMGSRGFSVMPMPAGRNQEKREY
jgi:hypothetical protein